MRTWGYEALPLPGQPPPLAEEAPPGVHRYRPRPGLGHRPLPAGERGGGIFVEQDGFALSPQGGFFPTSETLFTFERQGGRWEARPLPEIKKQVLFGLHPCDAHGIALMDAPFLSPPADLHYQRRREATLLVGLACSRARPECFCGSVGGGPQDPSHLEGLLIPTPPG